MGVPETTAGGGGPAVLEDPTGRRARWLRRAGRLVFLLFLAWLLAIVLGGLGLIPVTGIPFVHVLRPSPGPPPLAKLPRPRPPSAADLRPAVPANVFAARAAKAAQRGRSSSAPGHAAVPHGKSATAPGHTKTSPAAGVTRGRSTTAPGQTKKTTPTTTSSAPSKKPKR
jgi:hypothetical protein